MKNTLLALLAIVFIISLDKYQHSIKYIPEAPQVTPIKAKTVNSDISQQETIITQGINKSDCEIWMEKAGVEISHSSKTLIQNESNCRPNAINPSSGACGIPQALPCGKMPCTLEDPICQLRWMNNYVITRYSTWSNALNYWHCRGYCSNNFGTIYKSTTWY
jgi:hypothetical protein